ncbi:MAG: hypothetical protein ABIX01_09735 [Chitinophagaceae bacterium]
MDIVRSVFKQEKLAIAARQIAYKGQKKYATRIINALAASQVSEEKIAEAAAVNRKIQGIRAAKLGQPKEGEPEAAHSSVSQQSFDSMLEHMKSLKGSLDTEPNYTPNEADTSLAGIASSFTQMQTTNQEAKQAEANSTNARANRTTALYNPATGIIATIKAIKKYCRSVTALRPASKKLAAISLTSE